MGFGNPENNHSVDHTASGRSQPTVTGDTLAVDDS